MIDAANCTLLVSSVANGSGTGGIRRHGSVEIVAYDLRSGSARRSTLSANFEADDHDSAALYVRPDGRYVAMFSRHNTDTMSPVADLDRTRRPVNVVVRRHVRQRGRDHILESVRDPRRERRQRTAVRLRPHRRLGPPLPRLRRPRVDVVARRATAHRSWPTIRALRHQQHRQHPPHHHRATSPRLRQQHLPRRHPTRSTAAIGRHGRRRRSVRRRRRRTGCAHRGVRRR